MKKIKVLIVDDSAFIRKILKDILESEGDIEVIATAKNGSEALEFLKNNDADVITLDVEMPVMDGLETLRQIMKTKYTPVVMLSSLTKDGAEMTFKALDLGAVSFIAKPSNIFKMGTSEIHDSIVSKIKEASNIKSSKILEEKKEGLPKVKHTPAREYNDEKVSRIIAIGTSTGGPRALQEVLANISPLVKAPILIVQHMPKGFTKSLADRLNTISQINVKEAEDDEILQNGTAYIAPGDRHLNIKQISKTKYKIKLEDGPNISGHKPSVDSLFESLCRQADSQIMAVVMTGMGSDGSKGIKCLKETKKSFNVAEDESSCVVYGMPKSAVATGAVDKTIALTKIASEINKWMGV